MLHGLSSRAEVEYLDADNVDSGDRQWEYPQVKRVGIRLGVKGG